MYLDPKKYRFKSTITGKLKLQINTGIIHVSGGLVSDKPTPVVHWRDAKVTDLLTIIKHPEILKDA